MNSALVVRVTWHASRFHGRPEWPPAPARLFQALVAGAGPLLSEPAVVDALRWLEGQRPPTILAPRMREGQAVTVFVPNNDLDAVAGDPQRIAEIRTGKTVEPRLLEAPEVTFVWPIGDTDDDRAQAAAIAQLAERLYQLGRGVDMAWASAEVVEGSAAVDAIDAHGGTVHRPTPGGGDALACPRIGTFDSLQVRFEAQARFRVEGTGRSAVRLFVQPPKAVLREVGYDDGPERLLFELRVPEDPSRFAAQSLTSAHALVVACRDASVARLTGAGLDRARVDSALVGPRPGEASLPGERCRIVALPSIGHENTDPRIRRVLVEVPRGAALPVEDVRWAFSDAAVGDAVLVPTSEDAMVGHYTGPSRDWSSVTPLALPAVRRRIEPSRMAEEAKGAPERALEEEAAVSAVRQAVRHANITARIVDVEVSREPTRANGERAEPFAAPPRFAKERLWHVRVTFDYEVNGPLLLGDGRFLGLGLMAPVQRERRVLAWSIVHGLVDGADPADVAHHLRRAVLALAQRAWGRHRLPEEITGHGSDGSAARGHRHLCYVADLPRRRLLLHAPDGVDPRLARALEDLAELRAGRAGLLRLAPAGVAADGDPLLGVAEGWRSLTPYRVERHGRHASAVDMIEMDVRAACRRLSANPERVVVSDVRARPGAGVEASIEVWFSNPIAGPLLLGRTRHVGGGVFAHLGYPA